MSQPAGAPRGCSAGMCSAMAEAMGTWANGQTAPVCGIHAALLRVRGYPVVGLADEEARVFADESTLASGTLRVSHEDEGWLSVLIEEHGTFHEVRLSPARVAELREFLA